MKTHTIDELQEVAKEVRRDVVKMILKAGAGHPAGSLGMRYFVMIQKILNGKIETD